MTNIGWKSPIITRNSDNYGDDAARPAQQTGAHESHDLDGIVGEQLIDSTFAVIQHVLRARRCSLMLLDDDQHLVVHKAFGLRRDVVARTRVALGEPIAGRVAMTRQPLLITDIRKMCNRRGQTGYVTGSFISVPVASGEKLYGVLNAADKAHDVPFHEFDLSTTILLAQHVALCIENAELHRRVAALANTDGLTGVYNHRYFQDRLIEELARASRFDRTVALLMTDLDRFKEFNDRFGHPSGDLALREVAKMLREGVRQSDVVTRYGGDEFAIIAPETDQTAAYALAGRLVEMIAGHRFKANETETVRLNLSIGISVFPSLAEDKSELVKQADWALYRAKQIEERTYCWQ